MRGFTLNTGEKSFVKFFQDYQFCEVIEISKDLITSSEAFDLFASAGDSDLLVLQIGVADSLRKKTYLSRKVTKLLRRSTQTIRNNGGSSRISRDNNPKFLKLVRFLKDMIFNIFWFEPRTDLRSYEFNLRKLLDLASARKTKVILLGSILGTDFISNSEYKVKKSYTQNIFLKQLSNNPSNIRFIDVDLLLRDFYQEFDVFHLNAKGHRILADLIKDSILSFGYK
jgi:lysophospholipase L1-like esterase